MRSRRLPPQPWKGWNCTWGHSTSIHLCHLHRVLFGEVYDWAGELRRVDIAKGTTRFCTSARIRPEAIALLAQIDRETLEQPAHERVVERVADLYAELNMVHPFREGNGRTQRLFSNNGS